MKHIYRIIGLIVVIVVLMAALLYYLNEKNILKGPISDWINNIKGDLISMFDHTKDMVDGMEHTEDPIKDSISLP